MNHSWLSDVIDEGNIPGSDETDPHQQPDETDPVLEPEVTGTKEMNVQPNVRKGNNLIV